jgi:hypothetical protein
MPSLTLGGEEALMSLDWDQQEDGDYLVTVEAEVEGFKGHADGHVTESDFKAFTEGLEQLERSRKGRTAVASPGPCEFEVIVHAIDSVGHMGASGILKYLRPGDESPSQILHFSFEFEPSQLIKAVRDIHAV